MKKIYLVQRVRQLLTEKKNRLIKISTSLFIVMFMLGGTSSAQLLQWNTFGNAGTEATEPSVFNNVNISGPVNLTKGAGVVSAGNANRFGGSGWFNTGNPNPSTIANAVAGNDYIQFVVTPNAGYSFTPTSLVFNWDKSGTGQQNVVLRSSVDGYTANLGTVAPTGAIGVSNTITITGLSGISTATTFRLYGYGATATGGTGGFDVGTDVVNVQLNGTTCTLPLTIAVVTTQPTCETPTGAILVTAIGTNLEYSIDGGANWDTDNNFDGLAPGNYNVQVRSTASCVANFGGNPVVVNPAPGPFTITASAGANGTISPSGATVVNCGTDNVYTFTPAACFQVADVLVDGVSQGAVPNYTFLNTGADHTISVSFEPQDPLATPGELTGPLNVCQYAGTNEQITYSIPAVPNATSYEWLVPSTVSIVSGQGTNSITVTFAANFADFATKQIRVTALSPCGNSNQKIYYLSAQTPNTPGQIVAGETNICEFIGSGNGIAYTINSVKGASSYIWTAQAGTTSIAHV